MESINMRCVLQTVAMSVAAVRTTQIVVKAERWKQHTTVAVLVVAGAAAGRAEENWLLSSLHYEGSWCEEQGKSKTQTSNAEPFACFTTCLLKRCRVGS